MVFRGDPTIYETGIVNKMANHLDKEEEVIIAPTDNLSAETKETAELKTSEKTTFIAFTSVIILGILIALRATKRQFNRVETKYVCNVCNLKQVKIATHDDKDKPDVKKLLKIVKIL